MNAKMKKFFSYYRPYRRMLAADLCCAFAVSAIALVIPLCTRYVTKVLLEEAAQDASRQLLAVGVALAALIAVHTLCNLYVGYRGHVMGARMESDMRAELFDHYLRMSPDFYDGQQVGQLMTRLTNDVLSMTELYHHGPEDIAIALTKLIGTFVILLGIHAPLAWGVLGFTGVMLVYALALNRRMNRAMRRSKDRVGDINAQAAETLTGIRTVQSFANEAVERGNFGRENRRFLESRDEGYRSESVFYEGLMGFSQVLTGGVLVLGGAAILRASLDLPDLLTFLLCVGVLVEPILRFANFARLYQEGMTGFDRFWEMLAMRPSVCDAPDARPLPRPRGDIDFVSVRFAYPGTHAPVLRALSLRIPAGETVALVGASGAGKSTLCALLSRFYAPDEGSILLDGTDIRSVTLRSLRAQIGVVQQDAHLFSGTVLYNIGYGRPGATREEIVAAARQANAHDFIMALPDGYETEIGERGVKLSGGQRQRLSIARVFLKDPPVLIFDEATSALDSESEQAVQDSLRRLTAHRTTLLIAHRLSTLRDAQRIVVLADHTIAEEGTHASLLRSGGEYARLYAAQTDL